MTWNWYGMMSWALAIHELDPVYGPSHLQNTENKTYSSPNTRRMEKA